MAGSPRWLRRVLFISWAAIASLSTAIIRTNAQTTTSTVNLRLLRDTTDGSLVLVYGPIDLPPGSMPDTPVEATALGVDGWLRGFSVDLVDDAGAPVPHTMVHHVNLIFPRKRELFSDIMLRLAAAGSETAPLELPWFLGYRVHPDDSVLVSAMLHNPTNHSYHDVRMLLRMPFRAADALVPSVSIYPFYVDVMPPAGSHSFDVPAGRSTRSWEGKPAIPGRIIAVGGHMHQYGSMLRFEDVTAHEVLWEGKPDTNRAGQVVSFPTKRFLWRLGVPLDTSHVYRLTAVYDNPTGHAIADGGMGALGGVFLPAHGVTWPPIQAGNAEYELDRKLAYRLIPEPGGMKMPEMSRRVRTSAFAPLASSHGQHQELEEKASCRSGGIAGVGGAAPRKRHATGLRRHARPHHRG